MTAHIIGIRCRLDPTKPVARPQEPPGAYNAKTRQASGKNEKSDTHA